MKILIASNNSHKINEFNKILTKFSQIRLLTPNDLLIDSQIDENGSTFEENSFIKAKAFFELSKIPVIADDSGLEVDILDGKPGIFSARYAGDGASDAQNRLKLLEELKSFSKKSWTARFRCVLCFYDGNVPILFEGNCDGKIIDEERGINGFGYDPIFVPTKNILTFAEIAPEIKNKISHRAVALNKFASFLERNY